MERLALLQLLADGRFRSGETLGRELGVTRAAVWKQLQKLKALGLEVQSVRGRGYRLGAPVELIDAHTVRGALGEPARDLLPHLEIFPELDSTNRYLKAQAAQGAASGSVCIAEWQSAGRGRRGRSWVSPFGCNLYLSVLWRFQAGPAALSGLSLAVGIAIARAVEHHGGEGVGLKWPNDLLWRGRKLAGTLVELAGESAGPSHAVVGVGVNIRMPRRAGLSIDQPWTDLDEILPQPVSRNAFAAALLDHLSAALHRFDGEGLGAFVEDWHRFDLTAGCAVELHLPNGAIGGYARGIDENGALLIQVGDELRRFASGEVSVRMST